MKLLSLIVVSSLSVVSVTAGQQGVANFSNKVFRLPVYPYAKEVAGSSQRFGIDSPKGWASSFQRMPKKGWGRKFESKDDFKKVEAYYLKYAQKLGKLATDTPSYGTDSFLFAVDMENGYRSVAIGSKLKNGSTSFELYLMSKE